MQPSHAIIFATRNPHKVAEVQAAVGDRITIISLQDAGIDVEIPEPHDTLEANALEKSTTIHRLTGGNCFSEDTGLEVDALQGRPGVFSARYAGTDANDRKNVEKLLSELQGLTHRKARFRTVISLIWENQEYRFEGICEGEIAAAPRGGSGFGYDPVFIPEGSFQTFAEMSLAEKNLYSHRRKAVDQLILFLQSL